MRVETVWLDLPALVGAFSRRLHDAGLPVTPARSADMARALELTRPVARRRLYWTLRSIVVTDPTQVPRLRRRLRRGVPRVRDRLVRAARGDDRS